MAAAVLGTIQDDISEALTQPWPTLGGAMLNADARQVGDVVEMWFGAERRAALRLRSLKVPGPARGPAARPFVTRPASG